MKKAIRVIVIGFIISTMLMGTALGAQVKKTIEVVYNSVNLTVNGSTVSADNILFNGTTYAPIRAVAEALGKDVGWDQETFTASVNDKVLDSLTKEIEPIRVDTLTGKKTIEVVYNSVNLTVNGSKINADNILYDGTTYVPIRAVAEALGKDVGWNQETYTASINDKSLDLVTKDIKPLRVDTITVNEKEYKASYFGKHDFNTLDDIEYREFWRLEDAYEDFKDIQPTNQVLPYDNYPMLIETGQIFFIDYTKTDGTVRRDYHSSDGIIFDGKPATRRFTLEDMKPLRVDTITVDGKEYKASYFGQNDMSWAEGYEYREFWRLENAYEDFKDNKSTSNVIPYNNYPMWIEIGQVLVIDYTKTDGSVIREYYRSDGDIWEGKPSAREFLVGEIKPLRVGTITVDGKEYKASYFGQNDMTWLEGYEYREFWRLENAYQDFKGEVLTGNVLPYDNYIMFIEPGQVFVIYYTLTDGSVRIEYHRSDGNIWEGSPVTEEFTISNL